MQQATEPVNGLARYEGSSQLAVFYHRWCAEIRSFMASTGAVAEAVRAVRGLRRSVPLLPHPWPQPLAWADQWWGGILKVLIFCTSHLAWRSVLLNRLFTRSFSSVAAPDLFTRLLCGLCYTRLAPTSFYEDEQAANHLDGSPVDFVAAAIVGISTRRTPGCRLYHAVNPHAEDRVNLDRITDWMERAGECPAT
jgi:hypothetical protein